MTIVIANQKGGVGKTTLSVLFALYIKEHLKQDTLILDLDFQKSVKTLWDQDNENFSGDPVFEVLDLEMKVFPDIREQLRSIEGHVIIDLPGKMDDNELSPIFQAADLVVCPFTYDKITFESTAVFAAVVHHIQPSVPFYFIPNRVKGTVRYGLQEQVGQALKEWGKVSPPLSDRVCLQRITTRVISSEAEASITPVLSPLLDLIS